MVKNNNEKEKWDEYKKVIEVQDNLDFFKKSFFSRQKNKKIFKNLNRIESITTIKQENESPFYSHKSLRKTESKLSLPPLDPSLGKFFKKVRV